MLVLWDKAVDGSDCSCGGGAPYSKDEWVELAAAVAELESRLSLYQTVVADLILAAELDGRDGAGGGRSDDWGNGNTNGRGVGGGGGDGGRSPEGAT